MRALVVIASVLALSGCASLAEVQGAAPRTPCLAGEPMVETMLFLGMARPGGEVSETEFAQFIEEEVTPRWQEGYTALDGSGLWYSEQRRLTERERSRVLIRLHDGGEAATAGIEQIRWAYVRNFAQDAVLRVDQSVCADF